MTRHQVVLIVSVLCFIASVGHGVYGRGALPQAVRAVPQQPPSGRVAAVATPPRAVLDTYCVTCHNQRMKTAGLTLDAMDLAHVSDSAEVWEKVVRKLRTRAMPPPGRPRPDKAGYDGASSFLEAELDRAALAHPNPGRPTLHRLNRAEYSNAIRDVLGLEIDAASLLPSDSGAYGFDNVADALSLSPVLTERYLGAAAKISQMALGRVRGTPTPETFFTQSDLDQRSRVSADLPLGSRGGIAVRYYFPVDGEYQFKMEMGELGLGGVIGLNAEPNQLDVSVDGVKVWTTTIGGKRPESEKGVASIILSQRAQDALRFRTPVKAGSRLVQVYFVQKTAALLEDLLDPDLRSNDFRHAAGGEPEISSVAISGPYAYAAVGQNDSPSRRRLFVCRPTALADEAVCARKIITALARRAYRRPVTDRDLQDPLALYREGARREGFESGLELAVRGILVSPEFLFRFENQPETVAPNTPYRITDLELASRLSFFLWSSIPDDALLDVAAKGTLRNPTVLSQQVRRMLADARAEALVDNFAGQWLHVRNVSGFRPSPELLFHFDDNLRQAFQRETELFFGSIMRENRSVLDLLDADYTFLNERLAKHYGIPGVYGDQFRRVTLPADSVRRGLLGQGSILTDTSRVNRTSPVIRGKWILENIFGTPPPPPPPDVPELKEASQHTGKVLPMREQMAQHRANPVCASCHAQMDQLGFALENFDAIGEWRDTDASGLPIDASGTLPDGTAFKGPAELRKVLMNHSDDFMTTLTEKLLTYALGRGLDYSDAPVIRQIKREAAGANDRFDSLILGIIKSTPFQMRMAQERTN
jgi:mono/diheme cytochrome c family protein